MYREYACTCFNVLKKLCAVQNVNVKLNVITCQAEAQRSAVSLCCTLKEQFDGK